MSQSRPKSEKKPRPGEPAGEEVLRVTLALKLVPTEEQASVLTGYFDRFRAAVQWLIPRIPKSKEHDNEWARFIADRKKWKEGQCPVCGREKKPDRRSKNGEAAIQLKWRTKADKRLVCSSKCVLVDAASRILSDRRGCGFGLSVAELMMAFDTASAAHKSRAGALRRQQRRVSDLQDQIDEWTEVMEGAQIEREGRMIPARWEVQGGKYVHYDRRNTRERARALSNIPELLKKLRERLGRLEELSRATESASIGTPNRIKLSRSSLLDFRFAGDGSWVELQLGSSKLRFAFAAPAEWPAGHRCSAKQRGTHERYIQSTQRGFAWLSALKEGGNLPETTIHRRGSRFTLSIPVWKEKPQLTAEQRKEAMPVGMDVGERRHVLAALRNGSAPCYIKFFRSSELADLRRKHRIRLEKLNLRKQNEPIRRRTIRQHGRKSSRRLSHREHSLTRKVADHVLAIWEAERRPLVVGVEDVKDLWDAMREEKLTPKWLKPLKPDGGKQGNKTEPGEGAVEVCRRLGNMLAEVAPSSRGAAKLNPRLRKIRETKARREELNPGKLSQAIADALSKAKRDGAIQGGGELEWLCQKDGARAVHQAWRPPSSVTVQQLNAALKQTIEHERVRRRKEANLRAQEAKAFRSFIKKLEYKLYLLCDGRGERVPLELVVVDPADTSAICYRCGTYNKHYKKQKSKKQKSKKQKSGRGGTVFRCEYCRKTVNSDLNAALNIAKKAAVKAQSGGGA